MNTSSVVSLDLTAVFTFTFFGWIFLIFMFDLLLVTSVLFSDAYILPYQKADLVACQATISSFFKLRSPPKAVF